MIIISHFMRKYTTPIRIMITAGTIKLLYPSEGYWFTARFFNSFRVSGSSSSCSWSCFLPLLFFDFFAGTFLLFTRGFTCSGYGLGSYEDSSRIFLSISFNVWLSVGDGSFSTTFVETGSTSVAMEIVCFLPFFFESFGCKLEVSTFGGIISAIYTYCMTTGTTSTCSFSAFDFFFLANGLGLLSYFSSFFGSSSSCVFFTGLPFYSFFADWIWGDFSGCPLVFFFGS